MSDVRVSTRSAPSSSTRSPRSGSGVPVATHVGAASVLAVFAAGREPLGLRL